MSWFEGLTNTWKKTLGNLKKTLGICPPRKDLLRHEQKASAMNNIFFEIKNVIAVDQGWATYGPRDNFVRPAAVTEIYTRNNRTSEDLKFFTLHRSSRWKTEHLRT